MEFNGQTELTRKIETASDREQDDSYCGEGRLGSREIEKKEKRIHGHGQQCGDHGEEEGMRGLTGNGKNTIKI